MARTKADEGLVEGDELLLLRQLLRQRGAAQHATAELVRHLVKVCRREADQFDILLDRSVCRPLAGLRHGRHTLVTHSTHASPCGKPAAMRARARFSRTVSASTSTPCWKSMPARSCAGMAGFHATVA